MVSNKTFFLEEFKEELGGNPEEDVIVQPDITVTDNIEIDLGNRRLLITAYQPAHSHTDISVFDKKTNTLWLSDLLFIERIPALDGSLRGWLNVMETIKPIKPAHIIPGHGPINLQWFEAIQPQIIVNLSAHDQV